MTGLIFTGLKGWRVGFCLSLHLPHPWEIQPRISWSANPPLTPRNLKKFRRWQCEQVRALRGEAKGSWKRLVGVESACSVDCRFKLSSHKMMFIVNSEDYMYRRGTLCRAKQVPFPPCPETLGLAHGQLGVPGTLRSSPWPCRGAWAPILGIWAQPTASWVCPVA